MSRIRDYASDARRVYLPNARTKASNAWYRAAGRRIQGQRQRYRNWLNGRYHARGNGKAPLPDRVTRGVGSRTPVYRNRVNPATGRPRRADLSSRRERAARQRLYGDPRGTWRARTTQVRTGRSR